MIFNAEHAWVNFDRRRSKLPRLYRAPRDMPKDRVHRTCKCPECSVGHDGQCGAPLEPHKQLCAACKVAHEKSNLASEAVQKKQRRGQLAVEQSTMRAAASSSAVELLAQRELCDAAEVKAAEQSRLRVEAEALTRQQQEAAGVAAESARVQLLEQADALRAKSAEQAALTLQATADRQLRLEAERKAEEEAQRRALTESQLYLEQDLRRQADEMAAKAEERHRLALEQTKRLAASLDGLRCPELPKSSIFGRGSQAVQRLGKGGFGVVTQHRFVGGGFIALKTAKVDGMPSHQAQYYTDATINEVKLLHYLASNANVIGTYGFVTTIMGPSFALEYASHGSLMTFLR